MFRSTENFLFGIQAGPFADPATHSAREPIRSLFEQGEEIGTLMPVYAEIARRLSRNAYTSYGATL